jgi:hypothetical protein
MHVSSHWPLRLMPIPRSPCLLGDPTLVRA